MTHTLVVPDDCEEMVTLFTLHGALMYVDVDGKSTGYDDVFARIDKYREQSSTASISRRSASAATM